MKRVAVRNSGGIASSSQRSRIRRKNGFSDRIDAFGLLSPAKRRLSNQSRQSNPEMGACQSEALAVAPESVYATGGPADSRSVLHQLRLKTRVQSFWQNSPCDSWFTSEKCGTPSFYQTLDEHRYKVHPRLVSAAGIEKTRGKRVLEIGCGCGSEAERFARAGASYTAVDLTNAAVSITQRRFQLGGLQGRFAQGDAENLPFDDGSFDLVYSHGVLHHTPDTPRAIREVHRVLAPGGRAVIMLYYQDSFNYHVNLRIVRRLRAHCSRPE